ncbi:TetR family transcriptional regulator [Haloactinospora alba]|uniref:TetR family transcriptional regulator n=1 Tax=Haloactinospora alba TaxID=405555 RepID=A0A543NFP2_9ACTN|nr:TetR family transcriptional regulator [Haloactinospora alba]TQN30658.1 TetR family transcriptional regulator [Haloactinospora alba]
MATRDASATRRKLLEAGRGEFAESGIAGARIDRIAERAGVNKERVYGHFGSKEKLFQAVLDAAKAEHSASLPTPGEDIGEWVGRVYDAQRNNPTMLRLMMWESLYYGTGPAPDEEQRADHYADKIVAVARTLGIEPDSTAARTVLSLLGLAAWSQAMPQSARLLLGPDAHTERGRAEMREHVVRMARAAVRGVAPPEPDNTEATA